MTTQTMKYHDADEFGPTPARGSACFHCGLPVPDGLELSVSIDGASRPMCCYGCQAVAQAIVAAGHENFYRVRTEPAPTGRELLPEFLRQAEVYDAPEVQSKFVRTLGDDACEASLMLDGITCAACVWLNERHIAALPGVEQVRVNYATQRAWVRWDPRRIRLSQILQAIQRIGYRAIPFDPERQEEVHRRQRRQQQRRLAVAGLFGMQVMMLSVSLYGGAWWGMEAGIEQFFRYLSLLLCLPVVAYAALPFFGAAWRDLKRRAVSMDLPVSLAIGVAFAASMLATLRGHGEIYFDSVVMFVFFLSASRYFESMARQRCAATVERLAQSLPLTTTRLSPDGATGNAVPAAALEIGDRVLVRPGETVPADGVVVAGQSALDESLLSGESLPLEKGPGDRLLGGSINVTNPMQMMVEATGADTVIAEIQRTIERAQADKPALARIADRVAARFISVILVVVAGVAVYWFWQDPARWFEIALAVLIVTCPCALSLATPTAISAVLAKLQADGLLVKRGAALEQLTGITHVVFDKTGTLTAGRPELGRVTCSPGGNPGQCLELAAALERQSEHPLAKAVVRAAGETAPAAKGVVSAAGGGVRGSIDGAGYAIGSSEFIAGETGAEIPPAWLEQCDADSMTAVFLARETEVLAMFTFDDTLRDDASPLVGRLRAQGKSVVLMTGDRAAAAKRVAAQTGIEDCRAGMSPLQKMRAVEQLQAGGARVLMVGDGVNDAPVLARADVSIAMGEATSLAKTSADIVLIASHIAAVATALDAARRTRRIIRQNIAWALLYNFGAIPAAAAGLVQPWLAAIGMSLSSLLVVINALRLSR